MLNLSCKKQVFVERNDIMKAISIQNPWAHFIVCGDKKIEVRSWNTEHRGDLLICSSSNPKIAGTISGYAVCIVSLDDVTPFRKKHLEDACMDEMPAPQSFAWHLSNVRLIKPFPVKGKLNFYNVEDKQIVELVGESGALTDAEKEMVFSEYYMPLTYKYNKIGSYFKDTDSDTIVRWRVGQDALEYFSPNAKEWQFTDENSIYEQCFYDDTSDCLQEISISEAHKLLDALGCAKPYGE